MESSKTREEKEAEYARRAARIRYELEKFAQCFIVHDPF